MTHFNTIQSRKEGIKLVTYHKCYSSYYIIIGLPAYLRKLPTLIMKLLALNFLGIWIFSVIQTVPRALVMPGYKNSLQTQQSSKNEC